MARSEPSKPIIWSAFKIAAKVVFLGVIEAPEEATAIEKGATENREVIFCADGVLSATPLTYRRRRDDSDFEVFYFSKLEDAQACRAVRWGALARAGGCRDGVRADAGTSMSTTRTPNPPEERAFEQQCQ
jgi:hypothetical protein